MQQALYNEPKRARLLGGWDVCTNPLGVSNSETQALPSTAALGSVPAQSIPSRFKQAVRTGTPDQHWPATLADSHNVSSALFMDKGRDYQILQKDLGNSKTISPSTLKIKYTSADACPEIVGSS